MAIGDLASIISKIRKLTGSGNDYQLTDAMIIDYINSGYLYDFPAEFRSLKLEDRYTFDTIQGKGTYPFDSESYTSVKGPCMVAKRPAAFFQDPETFFSYSSNSQYQVNFTFGDGTNGSASPYTGFTTGAPVLRSINNDPAVRGYPAGRVQNILITANTATSTLNVTDVPHPAEDGFGTLIGDVGNANGLINYFTGEITGLVFSASIPSGNPIQIQYYPIQLNLPQVVLFFQNQFTLWPVPDKGYTVELIAYRQPSQALLGTGTVPANGQPEQFEWWETLAFIASKKIYQDRLDPDGVAMMDMYMREAYDLNETRTYAQLGTRRIPTIFNNNNPPNNFFNAFSQGNS